MRDIATILITMPIRKGDPTEFTYSWAEKAAQMAKDLKYNVMTIKADDNNYNNVTDAIKRYKPKLYVHFGHGCPSSLQGQQECQVVRRYNVDELICMAESPNIEERQKVLKLLNPIGKLSCPGICSLDVDPCSPLCAYPTNINLLKGSIVFAIACHSASMLGKCAINYGVNAYIGEDDLLMFPVDSMNSQDLFGDMHLAMLKELLLGKSVQEAEKTMSELEDVHIRKFKKIKYVSLPLLWNKIHRKVLGNKNAMIYE